MKRKRKKVGHYCNCHKKYLENKRCVCKICNKFLGIWGELYGIRFKKTRLKRENKEKGYSFYSQ